MPRIVLVDDDFDFLDLAEDYLVSKNFDVTVCGNPIKARRIIRRIEPDAVVLDLDMPGFSGYDILKQIRSSARTARIPVLFLTAHPAGEASQKGFAGGLDDFVTKPIHGTDLASRLHALIQRFQEYKNLIGFAGFPAGDAGYRTAESRLAKHDFSSGPAYLVLIQIPGMFKLTQGEGAEYRQDYHRILRLLSCRFQELTADAEASPVELEEGLIFLGIFLDRPDCARLDRACSAANVWLQRIVPDSLLSPESGVLRKYPRPELRRIVIRISYPVKMEALLDKISSDLESRSGKVPEILM